MADTKTQREMKEKIPKRRSRIRNEAMNIGRNKASVKGFKSSESSRPRRKSQARNIGRKSSSIRKSNRDKRCRSSSKRRMTKAIVAAVDESRPASAQKRRGRAFFIARKRPL